MQTTYLDTYAVTSFDTHAGMVQFLRDCTLTIIDIDHLRRYVAWQF